MRHICRGRVFSRLLVCLAFVSCAWAEVITIAVEARVDTVTDTANLFGGAIQAGDTITGHYIYDSDVADTNPSGTVADYSQTSSACEFTVSVKGFEFRTNRDNVDFVVEIVNDNPTGGMHDAYAVVSYDNDTITGETVVEIICMGLLDYTAAALLDTNLPTDAPTLSDWGVKEIYIETSRVFRIDATLTSMQLVPEPSTMLLIAVGALLTRKRST